MEEMGDILGSSKTLYWAFTASVTLILFYAGVFYELPLWLQLVPITVAALGASTVDRSWRGASILLGVTLLMYVTYCLRHFGPL